MHLTRTKLIHTVNADLTDLECKILRMSLLRYLVDYSDTFHHDTDEDRQLVEDTIRAMIKNLGETIHNEGE